MAARALIARFQQESGPGLNTTAHGDRNLPGGSHGIAQWNRERLDGLKRFGGDNWTDAATQARYVLHELNTSERGAGDALRAAQNPEQALHAAMNYERPQGWTRANPAGGHGYANTQRNFVQLGTYLGSPAAPGTTLTSAPMTAGAAAPALPAPINVPTVNTMPDAGPGVAVADAAAPAAKPPSIWETTQKEGVMAGLKQAVGDDKFTSALSGLATLAGGGGGSGQTQQAAPAVAPLQAEPDDSAQRMQAAQPLLASILTKRRGKAPGFSIGGMA